jgi:hypothetical protein
MGTWRVPAGTAALSPPPTGSPPQTLRYVSRSAFVDPLAQALGAETADDEVVGAATDADAEGEPFAGDAVDAGHFLGQQGRRPHGTEEDVAEQADAFGGARGSGQRYRVHDAGVGGPADTAEGREASLLGAPRPFGDDPGVDVTHLVGQADTDLHGASVGWQGAAAD